MNDAIKQALANKLGPELRVCGCIGPQHGEPLCPCAMRGVIQRDGRWIQKEVDLGPVLRAASQPEEGKS